MNARPSMPQTLPPALQGFTAFNQWLNYRLTPQANGKMKKEAIGREGYRVDPTDPARWMSYAEAAATGLPLAFSFSESDPFFFLDIDGALDADGTWSDRSRVLLNRLRGCAVEVSSSGKGLHIFGVGSPDLLHSNRRDDLGLEFYTRGRFVALTGNMLTPEGSVFHSPPELAAIVAEYFPPSQHTAATDWTDGPCEGWAGPTDDAELVRRASRHVSAAAAFAGKASFADLWAGDADALAASYPSSTGPYDASSADAALCAHLAWWTGKDCERMARLLRESGLRRDKHDREDYVQRTVLRACGLVGEVLCDRPPAALPVPKPPASSPLAIASAKQAAPELVDSSGFLRAEQMIELFRGCVYARDIDRVWMPNGELLRPAAFNVFFGGYQFLMDDIGKKTTDEAFKALTRNPMLRAPQVAATTFDPNLEPGAIVTDFKGREAVNTWLPPVVREVDGDISPFLNHLAKVLPDERDRQILLSWMAALVQYPGHKFAWAPVLQGVEGNGKSFFAMCCSAAVSPLYSHTPRSKDLVKEFNSWMHRKLFAIVDEARVDTPEMIEALRNLITEETQTIEPKNVDADSQRVFTNFMFTMNDKRAMKKTRNDRRLAMFYTAQQCEADIARDGMDGEYMPNLYAWAKGQHAFKHLGDGYGFAVITHFLRRYPIPDELNPIGMAHRAPRTSAHEEAVSSALGPREQELQEAIESGMPGFRGGWASSHYALEKLRETDKRVRAGNLDEILGNLGYVRHPGLKDGRVNNLVQPDGARSVLYVAKGRMDLLALAGAEAARSYTEAQTVVP